MGVVEAVIIVLLIALIFGVLAIYDKVCSIVEKINKYLLEYDPEYWED